MFRGDTAKRINAIFPNDNFYLLDTFEGFSEKDYEIEKSKGQLINADKTKFADTSIEYVRSLMPNVEKCHFIKGYFPQSTIQMDDNLKFKFVNIDVDLYAPIYAGLEYFYPKMIKDGVILVHDYFHNYFTGAKKAVDDFCTKLKLKVVPIGDAFSVMIIKE